MQNLHKCYFRPIDKTQSIFANGTACNCDVSHVASDIKFSVTRPEGAKAYSPGQRPGYNGSQKLRPVRATETSTLSELGAH